MPKLVFDIETVGDDFEELDDQSKGFLLKFAEDEEDIQEIKEGLSFSPLTGRIAAIGILNPMTDKGAVYFLADEKTEKFEEGNAQYIPCLHEKDILKNFWEIATHYDTFITFNGHSFDCPYLMIRSAVLKVKPTVNLMHNRYHSGPHVDILDRLTNFGASRRKGNNLHMWCRAFGIESPKSKGVTGHDVAELFRNKKYSDIARYCFDDLGATKALYEYWEKYINIK